jgi:hypothetical protein
MILAFSISVIGDVNPCPGLVSFLGDKSGDHPSTRDGPSFLLNCQFVFLLLFVKFLPDQLSN